MKTSRESHNCTTHYNAISGPKGTFTVVDTTVQQESFHGCYSSDSESHHIFSLYCRLLTQAYEQQANGEKDRQVSDFYTAFKISMFFTSLSTYSLLTTANTNILTLIKHQTLKVQYSKLMSFNQSVLSDDVLHSCRCVIGSGDAK